MSGTPPPRNVLHKWRQRLQIPPSYHQKYLLTANSFHLFVVRSQQRNALATISAPMELELDFTIPFPSI